MKKIFYSLLTIIGFFIVWIGIAIFPILTVEKLPKNFPIISNIPEDIDIYLEQKESEAEDLAEFLLSWSVYVFVLVFQRLVQTRENL